MKSEVGPKTDNLADIVTCIFCEKILLKTRKKRSKNLYVLKMAIASFLADAKKSSQEGRRFEPGDVTDWSREDFSMQRSQEVCQVCAES